MPVRSISPSSPPHTESEPIDDVALLQQQLKSLQIALESREQTITDLRNQAEHGLWSVGSNNGTFPDNLPCIAFLKDAAFRYVYVNKYWERTYNKTLNEWYNKTDYDLFPAQAEEFRRADRKVARTGSSFQSVHEVADLTDGNSGSTYWLLRRFPVEGGLIGGVAMDITELHQTEQSLHATEERYSELFNSVLTGIYRTTPQGEVLIANPALIRMVGYDAEVPLRDQIGRAHV